MSNRYKEYFILIISFLITFMLQNFFVSLGIIDDANIVLDLISWIVLFSCIYILVNGAYNLVVKKTNNDAMGIWIIILSLIIIILLLYYINPLLKLNKYNRALSYAEEKTVSEMLQIIEDEQEFIFLFTSEDCKYCVDFVPSIEDEIISSGFPVYYVKRERDTEDNIKNTFSIKTIPFLVKVQEKVVQNYFDYPIDFFEKDKL